MAPARGVSIKGKGKGPTKKKASTLQYLIYGSAVLALVIGISVMLPQVDTSLDGKVAPLHMAQQGSAQQSTESTEESFVDESNPLSELTHRLKQSLVAFRAGEPGSAETLIDAANELSTVYIHAKYFNEAITICTQTVTMIEERFGSSSLRLLPTLKLLTEATQLLGRWADSVGFLTYIESVLRAHYGLAHPDSVSITLSIMRMYAQLGDVQTANDVFRTNEALYAEQLTAIAARKKSLQAMQAASASDPAAPNSPRGSVAQEVALADSEAVGLQLTLGEMCHIQGTIHRRLYAAYLENSREQKGETEQSSEEGEEDGKDTFQSSVVQEENAVLIRSKAHMFFQKALDTFSAVLLSLEEQEEQRQGSEEEQRTHIRNVCDAIFQMAQVLQSFAHMRFQLEHDQGDETVALFRDIVVQSRRLRELQSSLVAFAVQDKQKLQDASVAAGGEKDDDDDDDEEGGHGLATAQRQMEVVLTDLAVALNNLGSVHSSRGELDLAESAIRESIDLRTQVRDSLHDRDVLPLNTLGGEHATASVSGEIAVAKSNLAKVLFLQGEEGAAVALFREALQLAEKTQGQNHELYQRVQIMARHVLPPSLSLHEDEEEVEESGEVYDHSG